MTKHQMEKMISDELSKLMKIHTGKGPEVVKTYIIKDCIIVRKYGILTPAEKVLSRSSNGASLIREARQAIMDVARKEFEDVIQKITECRVLSLHTDIDVPREERIEVFILDKELFQE